MSAQARVGDVGTTVKLQFLKEHNREALDISAQTTLEFVFRKPDGSTVTKAASFVADGADGWAQYAVETGLFDQSGRWQYEGHVVLPAGEWTTDAESFLVEERL